MTLNKGLRNRLKEQNWLEATKHDRNKYTTWERVRTHSKRDLEDLILLAKRLPGDKREEIFSEDRFSEFLGALLGYPERQNEINEQVKNVNKLREPLIELNKKLKDEKITSAEKIRIEREIDKLEAAAPWKEEDDRLREIIDHIDQHRLGLAAVAADYGLIHFIGEYQKMEKSIPIVKQVTTPLYEAQALTASIAGKLKQKNPDKNPKKV